MDKLRAEGADSHDLKQAVRARGLAACAAQAHPWSARGQRTPGPPCRPPPAHALLQESVLAESAMMIPETRSRLEAALSDLAAFVVRRSFTPPPHPLTRPRVATTAHPPRARATRGLRSSHWLTAATPGWPARRRRPALPCARPPPACRVARRPALAHSPLPRRRAPHHTLPRPSETTTRTPRAARSWRRRKQPSQRRRAACAEPGTARCRPAPPRAALRRVGQRPTGARGLAMHAGWRGLCVGALLASTGSLVPGASIDRL